MSERRRDVGATLPELLVSVSVLGTIVAVLATSLVVTFRQQDNTEGRLNVARAEQAVGMWIPADLASAATVDTDPAASPCGTACPPDVILTGSNALLLTWTTVESTGTGTVTVTHNVSYHFRPAGDGTFELARIECRSSGSGWTCESQIVLRDLQGPPGGDEFQPGVTKPSWVIQVSEPLAPDAIDETKLADTSTRKDANRVVVTINGGGDAAGAGGGINQISITAGGTARTEIDATSILNTPTFAAARSRCGGPIALIVDDSGSIGSAITTVRDGVRRFVETFAGTPTQIKVVRFDRTASVLGSSDWSRYFDMTVESDVNALLAAIPSLTADGGTNWEDAWFRTFQEPDGSVQQVIPETTIFFTDGIPTYERLRYRGSPGQIVDGAPPAPGPGWPYAEDTWYSNGSDYSQVAFDRAEYYSSYWRSQSRLIGVGVGSGIANSSNWVENPGAGYHLTWERGSHTYQKATTWDYQRRIKSPPGSWQNTSKSNYDSQSQSAIYEYRRINPRDWTWITTAEFTANDTGDASSGDGYRVRTKDYSSPYLDWEPWPTSGTGSSYRSTKVYAPPFTNYDPPVSRIETNDRILATLISGNPNGVRAIWDGTRYTNPQQADMYILPDFTKFVAALEAVALGECGGTMTVQTRVGGAAAADPFQYQNSAVKDSSGAAVTIEPTVVTTSRQFTSGTFDFSIPNGEYVTVDIMPNNLADLIGYSPVGWSCKAGVNPRSFEVLPIAGTPWSGVRVRVASNEAVSCVHSVTR